MPEDEDPVTDPHGAVGEIFASSIATAAANEQEKQFQNRIIRTLAIFLLSTFLVVGTAVGILVYNSVTNEPKINCIYAFSQTGVNDIHHLEAEDHNRADYPEAKCG